MTDINKIDENEAKSGADLLEEFYTETGMSEPTNAEMLVTLNPKTRKINAIIVYRKGCVVDLDTINISTH